MTRRAEISRYVLAGSLAFGMDLSVLIVATQVLGLHYLGANAVGYVVGMAIAYTLNTKWVFTEHRFDHRKTEFAVFNVLLLVGLGISELSIFLCHYILNMELTIAKIASACLVFGLNYLMRKKIIFTARSNAE